MKLAKLFVICAVFLAVFTLGCAQQGNINKVNASIIVKNMMEKSEQIKNMKADIFYEIKIGSVAKNTTLVYVFEKPSKVYVWDKKLNQITVSNGKTVWMYDKNTNTVYVTNISSLPSEKRTSFKENVYKHFVERILSSYNVTYLGTKTINGRNCYLIKLIPKNKTIPVTMEMWVDSEYWLPIKTISTAKSIFGNMMTVIEYKNLSVNSGVNESLFNFTPPKGAKVVYENSRRPGVEVYKNFSEVQKHVNFTLVIPSYTSHLKLGNVTLINSTHQTVIADYSNGTCKMMISESVGNLTSNPYAKNVTINGKKVLEWKTVFGGYGYAFVKNGVRVIVLSNCLSKAELEKVVESMLS